MKVPFITGFAENADIGNGHRFRNVRHYPPFVNSALAKKIRQLIDD